MRTATAQDLFIHAPTSLILCQYFRDVQSIRSWPAHCTVWKFANTIKSTQAPLTVGIHLVLVNLVRVLLAIELQKCGGLNKNGPQRLIHLNEQ